jgi:molecular chaperone DnaK
MAFGIDFGTTTTALVYLSGRIPVEVEDNGLGQPIPSVVAINESTREVKVGSDPWKSRNRYERSNFKIITSTKLAMIEDARWTIAGEEYSATDAASDILDYLRVQVEEQAADLHIPTELAQAVVAIPIGFEPSARRRLRDAARDAGIEILQFVSEPTAAFLRYRDMLQDSSYVAVFDWGGGTLDVSILRIRGNCVEEIATHGMPHAGDEIDDQIARWAHQSFMREQGGNTDFDSAPPGDRDHLRVEAERAKRLLAENSEAALLVPEYCNAGTLSEMLDRGMLERISANITERAFDVMAGAIGRARLRPDQIDQVLLVGGTTKLRHVRARMADEFLGRVPELEKPEWAVSHGAAMLAQRPGAYRVMQRFCLELSSGRCVDLLEDDDVFDDRVRRTHLAVVDDSETAQLVFSEQMDRRLSVDDPLGVRDVVEGLSVPTQGFHREAIELETKLTEDLTIVVSARSMSGIDDDVRTREYSRTRFAYEFEK